MQSFTKDQLEAHSAEEDKIRFFLEEKACQWNKLQPESYNLDGEGSTNSSLESWELFNEHISVTFCITGSYSYQDWYTVQLPYDALGKDMSKAAENAAREREDLERRQIEQRQRADRLKRKQQYEKLKKEFE